MHRVLCVWGSEGVAVSNRAEQRKQMSIFRAGRVDVLGGLVNGTPYVLLRSMHNPQTSQSRVIASLWSVVAWASMLLGRPVGPGTPPGRHEDPKLLLQCFMDTELSPIPPTS